jgi:hypothetical protein
LGFGGAVVINRIKTKNMLIEDFLNAASKTEEVAVPSYRAMNDGEKLVGVLAFKIEKPTDYQKKLIGKIEAIAALLRDSTKEGFEKPVRKSPAQSPEPIPMKRKRRSSKADEAELKAMVDSAYQEAV